MAHSHRLSKRDIEALWEETQRLNAEVAMLQSRLAAHEDSANEVQPDPESVLHPVTDAGTSDVWNVWPYKQAIDAYHYFNNRFHSFHENLFVGWLGWHNRRAQAAFQQCRCQDEIKLKLIS